jgi:D-serine deaminase-like pyridoxal phosphate-dependent protein
MPHPATPYLRVDLKRLRHNIRAVAERAAAAGVALRPHVKTHKSVEIGRLQLDAGAVGITTATIGEAETFSRQGFDDIFVAYPLWLDDLRARRLRDMLATTTITIGLDSAEGAASVGRLLGDQGQRLGVLVEVDSGQHRSGVHPREAGEVATLAARCGLDVRGVFTFPGHSYAPDHLRSAARDESEALAEAADALRAVGIEPEVVSGGSTPSLAGADTEVLTELRPGVYAFGDAQQWELGTMSPDDIALTCRSTVVSHAGGRLVLDAGSKALGADRAAYATGYGRLPAYPDARLVLLAEHHAVADLGGAPLPPIGSEIDVVPNHVCAAVNLAESLYVDDNGEVRTWPVVARGQNS